MSVGSNKEKDEEEKEEEGEDNLNTLLHVAAAPKLARES